MTATATRAAFIQRETRSVVAYDSAVKTKYGELARDTKDDPVETYFDSMTDVATLATERLNLLKADRRRMQMTARGVISFTGGLDFSQTTPAVTAKDDYCAANYVGAIVAIDIDFLKARTTLSIWG